MTKDLFEEARALLKAAACRLWIDSRGMLCLGIWECMDSERLRQAAAMVCPEAAVSHLESPGVPLRLKLMPVKITRIDQARWKTLPGGPDQPGKHIDPETGIWPKEEWGPECSRGWVSDSRLRSKSPPQKAKEKK